jgi:hypothetical protein
VLDTSWTVADGFVRHRAVIDQGQRDSRHVLAEFNGFFTVVLKRPRRFRMLAMARYAVAMQPTKFALPLMFLSLATASVAHARGTIEKVDIKGLDKGDDAEMIENIEVSLSLYDTIGKPQGESRLEYLLSQAGPARRWSRSGTTTRPSPWKAPAKARTCAW